MDVKPRKDLTRLFDFLRTLPEERYAEIIKRSSPLDDLIYYHLLCQHNAVQDVIEIGTFKGLSALFWATAIQGTVHTINYNPREVVVAEQLAADFGQRNIEFITGDSLEVLADLPATLSGKYNVVYIDGNHSHHYAYNEFRLTEPHLNQEHGIIIFDDAQCVHPDGADDGGVPRAVQEAGATTRADFGNRFAHQVYGSFQVF